MYVRFSLPRRTRRRPDQIAGVNYHADPPWDSPDSLVEAPTSGMGHAVNRLEVGLRHVGIDLGRRKTRVTEHLLHHPKISPPFEEVSSEGVAQSVRVKRVTETLLENPSNVSGSEGSASAIDKKVLVGLPARHLTANAAPLLESVTTPGM